MRVWRNVDAPDLGSGTERYGDSTSSTRTNIIGLINKV